MIATLDLNTLRAQRVQASEQTREPTAATGEQRIVTADQ
jgi:hypothetical protein